MWYGCQSSPGGTTFDPWERYAPEVMVAWDRDVAGLLTSAVDRIELVFEGYEPNASVVVFIRGELMEPGSIFSACAAYFPAEGLWRSTMVGWRPWWLRP